MKKTKMVKINKKKENDELLMLVEIPKGSSNKYEFDHSLKRIILKRIIFGNYPINYGCIWEIEEEEKTINGDGDPVDLICLGEKVFSGCLVPVKIVGVLEMVDDGEKDDKILVINSADDKLKHIKDIADVNPKVLSEIEHFFQHYKKPLNKEVILGKWGNKKEAYDLLSECRKMYQKQKNSLKKI